jgi:hypothetical protein
VINPTNLSRTAHPARMVWHANASLRGFAAILGGLAWLWSGRKLIAG